MRKSICLSVNVYVRMCVCVFACFICVCCVFVSPCKCVYVRVRQFVLVSLFVYEAVHLCACVSVFCLLVCLRDHPFVRVHVCMWEGGGGESDGEGHGNAQGEEKTKEEELGRGSPG